MTKDFTEHPKANTERKRFSQQTGTIRVFTSVPTEVPQRIEDSIGIYVSGSTVRWYAYDFENNSWRKFTNTTVAEEGQSALEGDVTLSEGAGVTLTQSGQDIEIAASPNYYLGHIDRDDTLAEGGTATVSISLSFEPKLIICHGRADTNSFATNDWLNRGSGGAAIEHYPMVWANPTYGSGNEYQGFEFRDWNGTTGGQAIRDTSRLFQINNTQSPEDAANLTIENESSTGFDFQLTRASGNDNFVVSWQLVYIVIG